MPNQRNSRAKIQALIENDEASISANIEEQYVITTEDKIRILYDEYNKAVKESGNVLAWLGILLSLIITDVTCTFKNVWIFKDYHIQSFFYISTLVCGFLFLWSLGAYLKNRTKLTFSFFIQKIKGNSETEP